MSDLRSAWQQACRYSLCCDELHSFAGASCMFVLSKCPALLALVDSLNVKPNPPKPFLTSGGASQDGDAFLKARPASTICVEHLDVDFQKLGAMGLYWDHAKETGSYSSGFRVSKTVYFGPPIYENYQM